MTADTPDRSTIADAPTDEMRAESLAALDEYLCGRSLSDKEELTFHVGFCAAWKRRAPAPVTDAEVGAVSSCEDTTGRLDIGWALNDTLAEHGVKDEHAGDWIRRALEAARNAREKT